LRFEQKKINKILSASLAEDHIEVIYPEIGYFVLARVIDNLRSPEKTTKGSRMSVFSLYAC